MTKTLLKLSAMLLIAFAVLLTGCEKEETPIPVDQKGEAEISIDAVLEAALVQVVDNAREKAERTITGTLTAVNLDTREEQDFDWYAVIDEDAFTVESTKTIVLAPGTYDFYLVLTDDNHSYAGQALLERIAEGENEVAMTLRPVFGDVNVNFTVQQSANLKFSYPVEDLSALEDPLIGINIDDLGERVYRINPNTGFSDTWINVSFGEHTFVLTLSDGNQLLGRSIPSQQVVDVQPNVNILMDIVPLFGEVIFNLDLEGGDATFNFDLPHAVADEVGGVGNLMTIFRMTSTVNGNQEVNLDFNEDGDLIVASHTFTDFRYDIVNLALVFKDADTGDEIGYATYSGLVLSTDEQNITLEIDLRRRAFIGGNILAVVGVNVFDLGNAAVAGADVFVDGEFAGITGSGAFGTAGYLRLFLRQGEYTVMAVDPDDGFFGEEPLSVSPLDVTNIDIILDTEPQGVGMLVRDEAYGYGPGFDELTSKINDTFDPVNTVPNFSDLNQLLEYKALYVDAPRLPSSVLSQLEISNISTFIASGRKVMMLGEHNSWQPWNLGLAQIVGGTWIPNGGSVLFRVNIVPGLTENAQTIRLDLSSRIVGGGSTILFGSGEVSLWGNKAITMMDIDNLRNSQIGNLDNRTFMNDAIDWLNN